MSRLSYLTSNSRRPYSVSENATISTGIESCILFPQGKLRLDSQWDMWKQYWLQLLIFSSIRYS